MTRRPVFVAVLAVLVLLAGCGGAGTQVSQSGGDGGAATVDRGDAGAGGGGSEEDLKASSKEMEMTDGETDTVAAAGRHVIRTGRVRLRVDSYDRARKNLTAAVKARGGYVSDTSEQVHTTGDEEWSSGQVTLRVPSENFSTTLSTVKESGTVMESETNSEDVTDRVVDLRARLSNLRSERERLRTLYQRANDTEDVLAVANRLSDVQGEIERTEAKLRTLERKVQYSTITVELVEPRPDRPVAGKWYDTPVVEAFLDSVDGVVVVTRALIVGTAYAAPYVLAFGVPLVVVLLVFRRR